MEEILELYYADNAKKLHNMADNILFKLGFSETADKEDFYSLANEVFADVIGKYEKSRSFDSFLYACLCNRFKTEMTMLNRQKRQIDRMTISIDAPVGDSENSTLGDILESSFTIEREVFEKKDDICNERLLLYLDKLSQLQRQVLMLAGEGYQPNEIRERLHISQKQYADCNTAIHSYRNVSVLF